MWTLLGCCLKSLHDSHWSFPMSLKTLRVWIWASERSEWEGPGSPMPFLSWLPWPSGSRDWHCPYRDRLPGHLVEPGGARVTLGPSWAPRCDSTGRPPAVDRGKDTGTQEDRQGCRQEQSLIKAGALCLSRPAGLSRSSFV